MISAVALLLANASAAKFYIGVKRHWQVHRVVTPAVVGSSPTAPDFLYSHTFRVKIISYEKIST